MICHRSIVCAYFETRRPLNTSNFSLGQNIHYTFTYFLLIYFPSIEKTGSIEFLLSVGFKHLRFFLEYISGQVFCYLLFLNVIRL